MVFSVYCTLMAILGLGNSLSLASASRVDSACCFLFFFKKYTDRGSIMEISLCMPGLHRIKFMDTRQVCEYPDSTVLTVLKWRMITMLNRKLLEKQRV